MKTKVLIFKSIALIGAIVGVLPDFSLAQSNTASHYSFFPEQLNRASNYQNPNDFEPCAPIKDRLSDVTAQQFDGRRDILDHSTRFLDSFNRYNLNLTSSYYINEPNDYPSICICVEPLGQYCRPAGVVGMFCAYEIRVFHETIYLGAMVDDFMATYNVPGSQFLWGPQYCRRGGLPTNAS